VEDHGSSSDSCLFLIPLGRIVHKHLGVNVKMIKHIILLSTFFLLICIIVDQFCLATS
jgi:hypothetical protein